MTATIVGTILVALPLITSPIVNASASFWSPLDPDSVKTYSPFSGKTESKKTSEGDKGQRPKIMAQPAGPKSTVQNRGAAATANNTPPPPGPDISENHGDWRLACYGRPIKRCELSQRRIDSTSKAILFGVEFTKYSQGAVETATFVVPLGVNISVPLAIMVDGKLMGKLQINTCNALGCFSQIKTPQVVLDASSVGSLLQVQGASASGSPVVLTMPLRGFAEGYIKLSNLMRTGTQAK